MSKTAEMYDLSATLDLDSLSSLRPGSTILVSAPSRSEQKQVVQDLLVAGIENNEGAIAVSTDDDGGDWIADLDAAADGFPAHTVGAIDCQAAEGREEPQLDIDAFQYSVSEPTDLTGIGIGITKCFDRIRETDLSKARLGLTSLSTILTETDRKTTFKFCHVLASRLDSAGFLGVFTIDSDGHDEQTRQVVKQAFDGEVELRTEGGAREARVRGLGDSGAEWKPL